jgi:hypothetical protein
MSRRRSRWRREKEMTEVGTWEKKTDKEVGEEDVMENKFKE